MVSPVVFATSNPSPISKPFTAPMEKMAFARLASSFSKTGSPSPIPACKEANGYSLAWQHHKGRNPHHYEYWIDNVDNGGTPIKIPYKYVLEMIADYLAAGKTYQGKSFTFKSEYEWWKSQRQLRNMHEDTKMFLDIVFGYLMMYGFDDDLIYFANEHIYTNEHSLKTYHKHMEFTLRKNNLI